MAVFSLSMFAQFATWVSVRQLFYRRLPSISTKYGARCMGGTIGTSSKSRSMSAKFAAWCKYKLLQKLLYESLLWLMSRCRHIFQCRYQTDSLFAACGSASPCLLSIYNLNIWSPMVTQSGVYRQSQPIVSTLA